MKNNLTIILFTFIIVSFCNCTQKINTNEPFKLKDGDLVFQDLDCGPFCKAIEKVTDGIKGAQLSHIGIIQIINNESTVLEAGGNGVVRTPLDTFLQRSKDIEGHPKVLVGRINKKYSSLIPIAIENATSKLGKPYDDVFDIDNDQYYCSELIYFAFKKANNNKEIFHLYPMTFIDPDTDSTFGIWVEYYKALKAPIPEGKPGLNPGGISRSPYIDIVYEYGQPEGYNTK